MRISVSLRCLLLLAVAGATPALAQEPAPADTVRPPSPLPPALSIVADTTVLPFERPNGALLRPGATTFDIASARAGQTQSLGVRTVQVSESAFAGMPAWLITEARTGSAVETTDSLYLTRAELSPERWVATSGRSQLAASFAHDTLYGALQSYQGRASFTTGVGPAALVTPGMVERIAELLPLHYGYHALATLVRVELGTPRGMPAELAVDRDEQVTVGGQAVDCWVLTLRSGTTEERLWVTKEQPRVVKTEQAFGPSVVTSTLRVTAPALAPAPSP